MSMRCRAGIVGWFCCLVLAGSIHGQTINTFPLWNGTNALNSWGTGLVTPTYGQSFTATASLKTLQSMTFSMARTSGSSTLQFKAYVFPWTGSDISGSALFTSANQATPNSNAQTLVSVNTGNVTLTPGQQYVVFYSVNGISNADVGYDWGLLGTSTLEAADGYAGGNLVFNNNTDTAFSGGWQNPFNFGAASNADFAFQLNFAPVPEPTSIIMIGLGAVVCSGVWIRRRRQINQLLASEPE